MLLKFYVLRHYLGASLMVLIGLVAVVWLNHLLRMLEFVVNKGASWQDFLLLSLFPIPLWLMIALPMAGFIGIIWVIARLLADREIVVMQAIGMSPNQLSGVAMIFGGMISCVLMVNSLFILPASFGQFKKIQAEVRASLPKLFVQNNVFIDISDGLTLFVGKRIGPNEVGEVFIQDSRNEQQIVTYTAESGQFTHNQSGPILLLKHGQRAELNQDGQASAQLTFQSHSLDISQQTTENTRPNVLDMNEDSVFNLLDPTKATTPDYARERMAMGHYRLASPFLALSMIVIAVSILISGENLRGQGLRDNMSRRIIAASMIGILVQSLVIICRSMTVTTPYLWPSIYLTIFIPIIGGAGVMWKPAIAARLRTLGALRGGK